MGRSSPPVRALLSIPCSASGVGLTLRCILGSAAAHGYPVSLETTRFDEGYTPDIPIRESIPRWLRRIPYNMQSNSAERRLHRQYLETITPDDIAYLWPSVPLAVYEALKFRGIRIASDAINTRMAVAKPILDAAYASLGVAAAHGITEARIADQDARYALCDVICAPSPATEAALNGAGFASKVVPTGFGTWVPATLPDRPKKRPDDPVTFLFVGLQSVRKGLHTVLEAWRTAPPNARLRIVGPVEAAIRQRYGDVLALDTVSTTGFVTGIAAEYMAADVFVLPSLEEGDAIVTYEAAAHALPVIATSVGAGRFGEQTRAVSLVPPSDPDALSEQIRRFARSENLRRDLGGRARAAVAGYDWSSVGPRNFAALHAAIARK